MSLRTEFKADDYFDFLKQNVTRDADKLRDALIAHSAVIAGGSVLKVYSGSANKWKDADIDIYVNQKNAVAFVNSISKLIHFDMRSHAAPAYCMSFFRKNNILARLTCYFGNTSCDIMIVANTRSIKEVVTNFDLTFCEIWYDGKTIYSTEDVREKHGFLRKEYQDSLFKYNNYFIQKRIQKYTDRGFAIDVKKSSAPLYLEFIKSNDLKVIDNPEEWVVKLIISNLFDYRKFKENPSNSCYYMNQRLVNEHAHALAIFMCHCVDFTIAELQENLTKHITSHIMRCHGVEMPISFKSIYVYALHKFYHFIPKDYMHHIKTFIDVRRSDIINIGNRTFKEYFDSNGAVDTLEPVSHAEYTAFMNSTTEGVDMDNNVVAVRSFMKKKGNVVIVRPSGSALCLENKAVIEKLYKYKNWVYARNRYEHRYNLASPYIKIPKEIIGVDNGCLDVMDVTPFLRSKQKLFFVKKSDNYSIENVASYEEVHNDRNHQSYGRENTNMVVYRLYEYNAKVGSPTISPPRPESLSS